MARKAGPDGQEVWPEALPQPQSLDAIGHGNMAPGGHAISKAQPEFPLQHSG